MIPRVRLIGPCPRSTGDVRRRSCMVLIDQRERETGQPQRVGHELWWLCHETPPPLPAKCILTSVVDHFGALIRNRQSHDSYIYFSEQCRAGAHAPHVPQQPVLIGASSVLKAMIRAIPCLTDGFSAQALNSFAQQAGEQFVG